MSNNGPTTRPLTTEEMARQRMELDAALRQFGQDGRVREITFPCPVKQTGPNKIAVELVQADYRMFTDEFYQELVKTMGRYKANAFLEAEMDRIELKLLLLQVTD